MITIDYKSRQPIYEQLVERVRSLAAKGLLAPGEQLPSVRQLASELGVNPNTVQRAYNTLLGQGVITAVPGKGNFVCDDAETLKLDRRRTLLATFDTAAAALKDADIPESQALARLQAAYHEEASHD